MRSPRAELSPSPCHQQSCAAALAQRTGWPRYLGKGRAGGASIEISLLALISSLAPSSLPANKPQHRHRLRDEQTAEGVATRDETIQGYKIRFIAKAFHA